MLLKIKACLIEESMFFDGRYGYEGMHTDFQNQIKYGITSEKDLLQNFVKLMQLDILTLRL